MAKQTQTSYADVIQHFNDASKYATKYQQASRRYPEVYYARQQFWENTSGLLGMLPLDKTVMFAVVPLHLGTAIFEAKQLTPIIEGIVFGQGAHAQTDQGFLAFLTICTLLGSSLLAGYCFFKVSNKKDEVVPGRRHLSLGWLFGGLLLSLLYVGCIMWVIFKTVGVGEQFDVLYFLAPIALIEIGLSAAAVVGYTLLILHFQGWWLHRKYVQTERAMYRYTEKCALSFRYYRIGLSLYNAQQNLNLPCIDTPAIAEAISFHEGFLKPRFERKREGEISQ